MVAQNCQNSSNQNNGEVATAPTATPWSNTGLNSQKVSTASTSWKLTVRVDWLQGTIKPAGTVQMERLAAAYEEITNDKVTFEYGKGTFLGKQWANQAKSVSGLRIWWNKPGENGDKQGHALISLSGFVLSCLKPEGVFKVAVMLSTFGFKATRIDIALDDYSKKISCGMIQGAIESGNYAGFKNYQVTKNGGGDYSGWTINCGSTSSDRRLVIYNKQAESKGKIDSYRWEVRLRDKIANLAYRDWLALPFEEHPLFLASLVTGSVDFVQRGTEKNISRMPEIPWWKEFKEAVGGTIRYSVQQSPTTLQKAKNWISYQVAKTLQIVREVQGDESWRRWLEAELQKAKQRYDEQDFSKLTAWKNSYKEAMKPKLKVEGAT